MNENLAHSHPGRFEAPGRRLCVQHCKPLGGCVSLFVFDHTCITAKSVMQAHVAMCCGRMQNQDCNHHRNRFLLQEERGE